MSVRFDKIKNNYYKYNLTVGQKSPEEDIKKAQEQKVDDHNPQFKGLKNEEDLLTKNIQNLYGVNITKYSPVDKDILNETNEILAQLGYEYKVTSSQVASIANNVKTVVLPGLESVEKATIEAHIKDPNGPFADLFA